ncbi:hypothetical protein BkAM31D_07310 [Halalkalibacter krulwichiae]|nr:hypothetical protein BkAM31D_07310 [Halalkalibacter krulwichiae]
MKEIQNRLLLLTDFIEEIDSLLEDIPNLKIKHFALEAKALDASELKDFNLAKRYMLLLCMIYRSKISAIDSLVEMFLKRVRTIHNKGKEELELLREKHRSKTENLISVLAEVLNATSINENDTLTGQKIRELLGRRGGIDALKEDCESISSYNGNNYLPL